MIRSGLSRLAAAAVGAAAAQATMRHLRASRYATALERTNHRGRPVSLAAGPALAVGGSLGAAAGALGEGQFRVAAASLVAGLGAGSVGLYDDVVGARPDQKTAKGFHGHFAALGEGRVTTGLVKIAGVGAAGLAAASLLRPQAGAGRLGQIGRIVDLALDAAVIAGTANLVNLLDLRPGRAAKAGLAIGVPLCGGPGAAAAAGPVAAAGAVLPADLDETVMLGDAGANALGALLGVALVARTGRIGRAALLAGLAGLTAASERVSFTRVIERTPVLRRLDELGRLPRDPAPNEAERGPNEGERGSNEGERGSNEGERGSNEGERGSGHSRDGA